MYCYMSVPSEPPIYIIFRCQCYFLLLAIDCSLHPFIIHTSFRCSTFLVAVIVKMYVYDAVTFVSRSLSKFSGVVVYFFSLQL